MTQRNQLWIAGQWKEEDGKPWEFAGVFDSEDKARAACRTELYFIGPGVLNESLPHETNPLGWEGCYYPLATWDPRTIEADARRDADAALQEQQQPPIDSRSDTC